jgi:hypothetical protein
MYISKSKPYYRGTDNPRVRAGFTCPICYGPKDQGLVACWPCFRSSRLRYGDPKAEQTISDFESFLCSQETRR